MIKKIIYRLYNLLSSPVFGFISPSIKLSKIEKKKLYQLIDKPNRDIIEEYENRLSSFLGNGKVVTFAAGRMAFYVLLRSWGVGKGDEVILTGFTCSVMANAILRTGAKIIYADIDKDTLGTTSQLEHLITEHTKVIVAQHTFGIPCRIDEISKIAQKLNVRLIEDCAISLGSKYKGKTLGTWGNAAIFSTDHTKPLNTLIGGFCYISDTDTYFKVRAIRDESPNLSKEKQQAVVKRYIIENKIERISHKGYILMSYYSLLKAKLKISVQSPYMDGEDMPYCGQSHYPYPAQLPSVLAYIGIKSLEQYTENIALRKEYASLILSSLNGKGYVPSMITNPEADIVPLRIPILTDRIKQERYPVDSTYIWYKSPIVNTTQPLYEFGYTKEMCPIAESVCQEIMNIPLSYDSKKMNKLIHMLKVRVK